MKEIGVRCIQTMKKCDEFCWLLWNKKNTTNNNNNTMADKVQETDQKKQQSRAVQTKKQLKNTAVEQD